MAIQANELRIGNWLQFDNHIFPSKYTQVTARFFSFLAGGRSIYDIPLNEELNQYYKPIPLTEDILRAAGFEYKDMMFGGPDQVMQYWRKDWLIINKDRTIDFFNDKETQLSVSVKYVHQLQNLYFALTGEELQISL